MRALVLQHTPTEGPERVAVGLAARGMTLETRDLHAGDPVPTGVGDDQILIVMGGPMGVGDVGDPRWPFLGPEIALLRQAIARDVPVLGICLGAQLLAAAAGARVYPNTRPGPTGAPEPAREVGWGRIDLVTPGDPVLAGLPARPLVLHWHGDTFDLPPGAVHLASTPVCPQQAFRLGGGRQIGFQFHCELEEPSIAVWVREDADFVRAANGAGGGAQILADTARFYAEARDGWDRLLGNALDRLLLR